MNEANQVDQPNDRNVGINGVVLLPCPFCGVDPIGCPYHNDASGSWEIACCNCGGLMLAATKASVVEQWQERTTVDGEVAIQKTPDRVLRYNILLSG